MSDESPLSLAAAARAVPAVDGKRPSPSSIWRWAKQGIRGVRLRHQFIGRRLVTSRAALNEFFSALSAASQTAEAPPVNRKSSSKTARPAERRRRDVDSAESRLAAAGI